MKLNDDSTINLNFKEKEKIKKRQEKKTLNFILESKKIHGDKYIYDKSKYTDSKTFITIICPSHELEYEFYQLPYNHKTGQGCPKCFHEKHKIYMKSNTADFIEKAKKIHGDAFDYTETKYNGRANKIKIICTKHREENINIIADKHLKGNSGCKKCSVEKLRATRGYTTEEIKEKAKQIHGDKYDYTDSEYVNNKTKIIIKCSLHGSYKQLFQSHINGTGCPKCGMVKIGNIKRSNKEEFVERSNKIHNNLYDYSLVEYTSDKKHVEIICKIHGIFKKTPHNHLYGIGCNKCTLCPSCQLWKTMGKLCRYCEPALRSKLKYKTKEIDVVKFIRTNLPEYNFIHNRSAGKDCTETHLFPDIRLDCNYYHIIIEVDEFQHNQYKCDKSRMYNIIAKIGMPCVFLRYNPDDKNSDKNFLLKRLKLYLNLESNVKIWNKFGFRAEYLYYNKTKLFDDVEMDTYQLNKIFNRWCKIFPNSLIPIKNIK